VPIDRQHLTFLENEPLRVDVFLSRANPEISRNYLSDLFSKKSVTVNGSSVKKGHVLKTGDVVVIESFLHPSERTIHPNKARTLPIVHRSEEYVIIDKPYGLPTHPNDYLDTDTVANIMLGMFPQIDGVGDDPLRPGIVHRLDTNTSGLLIVALTAGAFKHFRSLFDAREVKKTYAALVLGSVPASGKVTTSLAHHQKNRRKMIAVERGQSYRSKVREAVSEYEVVESFEGYTLLNIRTLTGRMHQVRVHMSSINHPLCGDRLYQTPKDVQRDTVGLIDRHFLHASLIKFPDMGTKKVVEVCSSLPNELKAILQKLKEGNQKGI